MALTRRFVLRNLLCSWAHLETTMEKENSRAKSLVVSLEVLDLQEENIVELPVVLTRPKLPVSVETAAKQEDLD